MYRLYLIDFDGEYIELDVEELDFGVEFKISSLSDLSFRSGNRTKEITLKGTDVNNNAFGYIYRLGRSTNIGLDNKLFFNYNSLRQVNCLVYHNTELLFRGTLRLIETVKVKGVIYYKCVLTDSVIDVMKFTQDKLLTDLDLSDLRHKYTIDAITHSWGLQTHRWDGTTYSYTPFQLGSGYVYGYAYYGLTANTINNIYNYRPAVYVKELFDRIFTQDGLENITYEVRGDEDFNDKFNSLVVPNNQEKFSTKSNNYRQTIYRCSPTYSFYSRNKVFQDCKRCSHYRYYDLNFPCVSVTGSNSTLDYRILTHNANHLGYSVYDIDTSITCDAYLTIDLLTYLKPGIPTGAAHWNVQVFIREKDKSFPANFALGEWPAIYNKTFYSWDVGITQSSGTNSTTLNIHIPTREWDSSKKIAVQLATNEGGWFYYGGDYALQLINATASFSIPWTKINDVTIETKYNLDVFPTLAPAGSNIKQYDFIKSVMLLYNLFVYTEKQRPNHLIFQNYDDFYALATIDNLKNTALDWTNKVIYSEDIKKVYNLDIPKRYLYTYKEDKDYLNANYKDSFSEVYGQLKFTDEYGVTDEKKVEVLFSPSPIVLTDNRRYTTIRGGDELTTTQVASNIRINYYNGPKSVSEYALYYYTALGLTSVGPLDTYGEMCEYYRPSVFEEESLQFGLPKRLYLPAPNYYNTLPNLYSTYYINRVSELTDVDLHTIECKMILNNVDIATFDFRVPIYISTDMGNSYYKVLEISWKDERTPATVKLQSINISKV